MQLCVNIYKYIYIRLLGLLNCVHFVVDDNVFCLWMCLVWFEIWVCEVFISKIVVGRYLMKGEGVVVKSNFFGTYFPI